MRPAKPPLRIFLALTALALARDAAPAAGLIDFLRVGADSDITAVSARKSRFYTRTRRPDGTYAPESYAFGPGGAWRGEMVDDTIDHLAFRDVAK